jgi:hypothetical protein
VTKQPDQEFTFGQVPNISYSMIGSQQRVPVWVMATILFWSIASSAALLTSNNEIFPADVRLHESPMYRLRTNPCSAFQTPSSMTTSSLHVAGGMYEEEPIKKPKPRALMEPPVTETVLETQKSPPKSLPPKIVVLGSTGKVGRRVIRQLMALDTDMTIVAFVRNYDRACDILYDELIIERTSKGPKLQLVVMDLVPPSYVARFKPESEKEDDEDDENDEEEYSVSASRFYKNDIKEYDYRASKQDDALDLDPYLPLKDAISNATAVISTVGTIRTTVPFIDYLLKPWRIFLSPGKWCQDPKHPYYVNYMVHKIVLQYAEEAQRQRNREVRLWNNNQKRKASKESQKNDDDSKQKKNDKIRVVRISDHCVANPAYGLVNVVTNIFRSLVFRYQEKCEKLLSSSTLVDTIILRPGDLVDDIRNQTVTTMSISTDGKLPGPVHVGRDDVASLATLAAISDLEPAINKKQAYSVNGTSVVKTKPVQSRRSKLRRKGDVEPKHWNIAVGWSGQERTGFENAEKCMQFIVKDQAKLEKSKRRKQALRNASFVSRGIIQPIQRMMRKIEGGNVKPYGLFVLLPMLLFVYPVIISMLHSILLRIPIMTKAMAWSITAFEPVRSAAIDYVQPTFGRFIKLPGKQEVAQKMLIN